MGPGMHRVEVADDGFPISDAERERWSRTIGALGGEAIWQRLVGLHIAVIGCSRSGSLAAVTLARSGVRHLTLIDPDVVELHNLGEMDAALAADVGRPKAEALADHLRSLLTPGGGTVAPLVASIADPAALAVVKGCEVLVSCPDHDAARLAAAIAAALYHRVPLDIGTGIHFTVGDGPVRNRAMGADVRLILPGDGCLLCRGNLAAYAQAVDDLCHHRPLAALQNRQRQWHTQRAGSLRMLNQPAVGLGLQMLQNLVAERLRASTWAHIEFDAAGRLQVTYPQPPSSGQSASCPLCARAGLGDARLVWM